MLRSSFDNEVSHSPQVDNEKLYTDFKREFLDSLKQIDRRGFIEHEKKFLYSLEFLANNIGKTKKPVYEDIVQIYQKVHDTLHREKFSPILDSLKEILTKYVPFSEVPKEKTEKSKEKILLDWKVEIRKLIGTSLNECSKLFPSSFSSENRWMRQTDKHIDELLQSITPKNFEQKKTPFRDWIANELLTLPKSSQAHKLLENIQSFLDSFENSPPTNIHPFETTNQREQKTLQKETLPHSLEIRRNLSKILDHIEVIRSKQLTSPPEIRVYHYLRAQLQTLTEENFEEVLLRLKKFLTPLTAKSNSDNFKQLRTDFLAEIENILHPKISEAKSISDPVPLDFDSLVHQPAIHVSPQESYQSEAGVPVPANLPVETTEAAPPEEPVLPTTDGEIPFDAAIVHEEPSSTTTAQTEDVVYEPFTPEGEPPEWESHHVTPGTRILTLPTEEHEFPASARPTMPFQIQDLERLRAQMQGLMTTEQPARKVTETLGLTDARENLPLHEEAKRTLIKILTEFSTHPLSNIHEQNTVTFITNQVEKITDENYQNILKIIRRRLDSIDDETASKEFKNIKTQCLEVIEKILSTINVFVDGHPAKYSGKLHEGKFHDKRGKLIITKAIKDEGGRPLPYYDYTVEGNFENDKIEGVAHVTYPAETGGPIEVTGPVDKEFRPHGKCVAVNLNKSIKFVGEFIHGTPFEGKFYQFLSESSENQEGTPLLEGTHFASTNLEPVNEFGDHFFAPNGERLLDNDGFPLPNKSDPRNENSGEHSINARNLDSLPALDAEETPFEGDEFTMFGGMKLADFANESFEAQPGKSADTASKEKELTFSLPDGSMATYRGKLDSEGKPHDGDGLLIIEGTLPRTVKIPYENGIALREHATVHFSPGDHVEATLVGPVDINFLPDGKVQGQIHVEQTIYQFEGEVSHGIPEIGFIHCLNPKISYFGPITREFLPDDENVMSSLGIVFMDESEQTIELPGEEDLETNPFYKLNLDYPKQIEHTIEKALVSTPLNTDFAKAEQTILQYLQTLYSQKKENKNDLLRSLGEYLPELHTYINSLRLNSYGEENFSQEFRTCIDTLQNIYDNSLIQKTQKTGEFHFGPDVVKNKDILRQNQAQHSLDTLFSELKKRFGEIEPTNFFEKFDILLKSEIFPLTKLEKMEMVPDIMSLLAHSDTYESASEEIIKYLGSKFPPQAIAVFIHDVLEQIGLKPTPPLPEAPEPNLAASVEAVHEETPKSEEKEKETSLLSRNVRILRTQIRDLISDTIHTGLLSKPEHDAIIKDFSMSLRRNDFIDMIDFLETVSKGQTKLEALEKNSTQTFRTFCGNLEALVISAYQKNNILKETPFTQADPTQDSPKDETLQRLSTTDPEFSPIITENVERSEVTTIPPAIVPPEDLTKTEANEELPEVSDDGELTDPTETEIPETDFHKPTLTAQVIDSQKPARVSEPELPSIIIGSNFDVIKPEEYQKKLKSKVKELIQKELLSERLAHSITEEFYTLFNTSLHFDKDTLSKKISAARLKVSNRLTAAGIAFEDIRDAFESPRPIFIFPWQTSEKEREKLRKNPDARLSYALYQLFLNIDEILK